MRDGVPDESVPCPKVSLSCMNCPGPGELNLVRRCLSRDPKKSWGRGRARDAGRGGAGSQREKVAQLAPGPWAFRSTEMWCSGQGATFRTLPAPQRLHPGSDPPTKAMLGLFICSFMRKKMVNRQSMLGSLFRCIFFSLAFCQL